MSMNQGFSFFQGLSSSSGSGNMNYLSDYASIKSGSYGRLMKAYYGKGKNSSATASGSSSSTSNVLERILEERRNPKVSEDVKEANSNLVTGISNLKSSVATLQNSNTYTDTEKGQSATAKVSSAMKNFVSQYNEVVNASKKSTMTNKTAYVANMMKATAANADKLSEIGVTINDNGTLQFNESKLQSAELSKVQELFSADDSMSYGSTVMSRLQFAGITGGVSEDKNNTAGTSAASLKADGEALASDKLYEKVKDKDGNETQFEIHTDKETVGEALQELNLIDGEEGEYGLFVKTVNGITADYDADGVYWAFYVNGEYAASGVDVTQITEGDSYALKVE